MGHCPKKVKKSPVITHQSGCVCLALIVFVGPISSRQYEIAWSLDITRAMIGPLDM